MEQLLMVELGVTVIGTVASAACLPHSIIEGTTVVVCRRSGCHQARVTVLVQAGESRSVVREEEAEVLG
ncbi:hypothetical protein E3N88_02371 [Mikania micrantha]|uniref:Uncharacterized protein n=1 Tax=Mikania micrantha TaxID=192012 RepID=A0A5N6Q3K8_9ASTR|nr:hypothetical protein E3N88_02371 [Mikania micrantha]